MAFYSPAGDSRLYYEVYGEESGGPSLVFLNGTAQTTANYRRLPDTGHSIPAEAPEALMEAIAIFFTQFPDDAMP